MMHTAACLNTRMLLHDPLPHHVHSPLMWLTPSLLNMPAVDAGPSTIPPSKHPLSLMHTPLPPSAHRPPALCSMRAWSSARQLPYPPQRRSPPAPSLPPQKNHTHKVQGACGPPTSSSMRTWSNASNAHPQWRSPPTAPKNTHKHTQGARRRLWSTHAPRPACVLPAVRQSQSPFCSCWS